MKMNSIRRLVAVTVGVLLSMTIFAQELPKERISKWVTADMVYWHKDLPYYVLITDDTTGSADVLHSKKQAKYSEPAYFDTYGFNYIRTRWAVDKTTHKTVQPQQEIEWPVFVDGIAPVTTPRFISKSAYLVDGVRYFTKDLVMELSSDDLNSGVRSTYYSVNDSAYIKYTTPIALNPKDTFKVKYFSVDNVGNYEKVQIFKYNADDYGIKYAIDAFPPVTKLVTELIRGKFLGPNIPIEFSSKDHGSGVAFTNYTIDGGEIMVYDKPFTVDLAEGWHTLKFFSVDRITNKEDENVVQFYTDRIGPVLFISAAGGYFSRDSIMYVSDSTRIRLSVNDARGVKRVAYKLSDDKAYKVYTEPIVLTKNYKPRQDLRYFATDSVDNDSKVHVIKLHRDMSPPIVKFHVDGANYTRKDTTYVTSRTTFIRLNRDTLSGIASDKLYVNDKKVSELAFTEQTTYSVIDTVTDNIGNVSTLSKVYKCDDEAPVIEFVFSAPSAPDGSFPPGTIMFYSIKDKTGVDSFKITINGKPLTTNSFEGPVGIYKAEIVAIDYLKHSSMKSVVFTIR